MVLIFTFWNTEARAVSIDFQKVQLNNVLENVRGEEKNALICNGWSKILPKF
ncbi:hypothetical protein BJ508DRAFT_117804 [Ascobolus immersus RN42]|uniref:Uncharacterized protein n=1 Tax=Ascobolus immersus RN42 TaxID=1160509 RepID=A0A3N4I8M0_ASCIM|nr:hypothetical protein BJ508DRAFT_117804 [Ascobolus immersus RN42]